jgi:DNA-binding GntR family transcriptional regulator
MAKNTPLNTKSLKEQVYEYLQQQFQKQKLKPGATIDMNAFSQKLGISKTPLRDALIQLEMEGFVTISPRRGIFVNHLTLDDIRDIYQVIGALESSAVIRAQAGLDDADLGRMKKLNDEMRQALDKDNFDLFHKKNVEFHTTFLDAAQNPTLIRMVNTLKKRLYDFPRQANWIKEWELSSIQEHRHFVDLLCAAKFREAAAYIHDIHWSFATQEKFILRYYFPAE